MDRTQEDTEQNTDRREELMDEKQIKRANKNLDWFRSSWSDKDNRGLFDAWREADEYWEGGDKLATEENSINSNTNIVHANIEGQVALLVEQNISIQSQPWGPSDEPFAEAARVILEWVKEKNKMKRKLDVHERRREKFGTGIFRVLFDPDAINGFGLPIITSRNPAYVFFDPTITDIYEYQEGRFTIEVKNKSISWAKREYGEDLGSAIQPGYFPIESEMVFDEDEGMTDSISRDSYLHMWVFTKEKDKDGELKLRLIEQSGCGVILYDSFESDEPFFDKPVFPYFLTPLYAREGTVWAKSDAELIIPIQEIVDDLDDQIRLNARLSGNPQRLVDTGSGIDIAKLTNEPALCVPTNDINGTRWEQPPQMPQYIIQRRDNALQYEAQRVTRFNDQMTGQRQMGVDTATESLALQQAGASGIDHKKILLQETLSEVFEYCLDMVKEYYTEEMAFRITEQKGEFVWFRGSDLKSVPHLIPASADFQEINSNPEVEPPQWMPMKATDEFGNITDDLLTKEAMFDIEVTVGAGLPNNKAFAYQMIKEAAQMGAIDLPTYQTILRERYGVPIPDNPQQMVPQPGMPQPAEMPQMNANVMGIGAGGNPEMAGMADQQGIGGLPGVNTA